MQTSFYAVLAALISLTQANVTKPVAGDQWVTGEATSITWDPAGFSDEVDIALVPAGATDTSVVVAQIAMATANTGSQWWTPPTSIKAADVSVIIVNSQQPLAVASSPGKALPPPPPPPHNSVSETFIIVLSPEAPPPIVTETVVVVQTGLSTIATITSHVTVAMNTTTIKPAAPLTTAKGNKPAIAPPAGPFANATIATSSKAAKGTAPAGTAPVATRAGSASGTGAGATPQQTFTGAASILKMKNIQTIVPGAFAILVGLVFL